MKRFLFITIICLAFILRIFLLGKNPPSLYWDEASLGYNAYSIATTLRDEHGEFLPLSRFIAFGDYKPPGYIYAAVPSVLLFDLNEFAVRLPSMLAGLLMVIVTFYLVKELFGNETIALLSGIFLAVSPWAIQFSRAAFEANLAAFFNLAGIYLFLLARRIRWLILPSLVFFILSFYTFNANRIITPLIFFGLSIIYFKSLWANKKWFIVGVIVSLILLLPSVSYLRSPESKLRFQEVSIFNNLEPIRVSNERIAMDGSSWLSKIIHNRRILFAGDFLKHYFDNFSGRFLFTHGDVNPRLAVQTMGQLYVWDLPFLLLGIYWLIKRKEKNLPLLILWMLIVPIPAATARETPHALRIASILPAFQIIIAYGLYHFMYHIKKRLFNNSSTSGESLYAGHPRGVFGALYFLLFVICSLFSASIFYYLHDYYKHYPRDWSGEWQYGYKQMVEYVSEKENNYDHIFVTNSWGRPYIYFAFYQKYPLDRFLTERNAERDAFGFWDVKSLGKIKFNFTDLPITSGRVLIVTTPNNIPGGFHEVNRIKNPLGEDVFIIGEKT